MPDMGLGFEQEMADFLEAMKFDRMGFTEEDICFIYTF